MSRIAMILLMGVLLVAGAACAEGRDVQPIATPTPMPTQASLPATAMSCEQARDAIQEALDDFHDAHGEWPTADGRPGDIEWAKLTPEFMPGVPFNDRKCEWWVNSNPEGQVCLQNIC